MLVILIMLMLLLMHQVDLILHLIEIFLTLSATKLLGITHGLTTNAYTVIHEVGISGHTGTLQTDPPWREAHPCPGQDCTEHPWRGHAN